MNKVTVTTEELDRIEEERGLALFRSGSFHLSSGERSPFKIDCDALTDEDWKTLAAMVCDRFVPGFNEVVGVPTGGLKLAEALRPWADPRRTTRLVVDDVLTTGASLLSAMGPSDWGFVVFARRRPPSPRIKALFQMDAP